MNILVIFSDRLFRNYNVESINNHLKSFEKYTKHNFYYYRTNSYIPKLILDRAFDLIILHTTYIGRRQFENLDSLIAYTRHLNDFNIPIVAFPQDEYDNNIKLDLWLSSLKNLKIVFTNFERKKHILYKKILKRVKFVNVYTSYVNEEIKINNLSNSIDRKYLIGYRVNEYAYKYGYIGNMKIIISKYFDLMKNVNISTKNKDRIYSKEWFEFLKNCTFTLGCESGSSILINNKNDYTEYGDLKKDYSFYTISGRHFEAAICKTCQILLEGTYENILTPNVHYIEIKKDFSNIDEVKFRMKDSEFVNTLINNTYRDLILSKKYTYKAFVDIVFENLKPFIYTKNKLSINKTKFIIVIFFYNIITLQNYFDIFYFLIEYFFSNKIIEKLKLIKYKYF